MTFVEIYEARIRKRELLKAWQGNKSYMKLAAWLAFNKLRYESEIKNKK